MATMTLTGYVDRAGVPLVVLPELVREIDRIADDALRHGHLAVAANLYGLGTLVTLCGLELLGTERQPE